MKILIFFELRVVLKFSKKYVDFRKLYQYGSRLESENVMVHFSCESEPMPYSLYYQNIYKN